MTLLMPPNRTQTHKPTHKPIAKPTHKPIAKPTAKPTHKPIAKPTHKPKQKPVPKPMQKQKPLLRQRLVAKKLVELKLKLKLVPGVLGAPMARRVERRVELVARGVLRGNHILGG
ncbi:MAG: PT domain-containing protein [Gammaproteobacteria bacterium]|nr:PT domain-containing protein [Gammaproteobacteria bacterium]